MERKYSNKNSFKRCKNVGIIHYTAPPSEAGGVEIVIAAQTEFLSSRGYNVHLIYGSGFGFERERYRACFTPAFTLLRRCVEESRIGVEDWAKISFNFLKSYQVYSKEVVLDAYKICWLGHVSTFVKETLYMSDEEAEEKINGEALTFMKFKPYLLSIIS